MLLNVGCPLECGLPTKASPLKETGPSFPRSHQLSTVLQVKLGQRSVNSISDRFLGLLSNDTFLRVPVAVIKHHEQKQLGGGEGFISADNV